MSDVSAQIGQAWAHHRAERNNDAIREFENILKTSPDDVDALYGLGLALRATGKKDESVKMFQKALTLAEQAVTSTPAVETPKQGQVEDKLSIAGQNPRYMMLVRMIGQRLDELKSGVK